MSSSHRVRASIFASPGGPSSAVPTKKRPPSRLVFSDSMVEQTRGTAPTMNASLAVPFDDEDEPMEVDTSCVPSPVRQQPQPKQIDEEQNELETSGHVPCTTATTPRRKSMPTPGKRLCFTSKEVNNDEDEEGERDDEKKDETTQLELLMSNNPEDMPNTVKALVEDNKAMKLYDQQVVKEKETFQNVLKNRKALLEKAKAQAEEPLSSRLPVTPTDLFASKTETTEDVTQKLVDKFLGIVVDSNELSRKKVALDKLEQNERVAEKMTNLMLDLKGIHERKKLHNMKMLADYKKMQEQLGEWKKKEERFDATLVELKALNAV